MPGTRISGLPFSNEREQDWFHVASPLKGFNHATGIKALVATCQMASVGRARERGETKGFIKVTVDAASKRILGAEVFFHQGS